MRRSRVATCATLAGAAFVLAACVNTAELGSPAAVEGWQMGCYNGYTDAGIIQYWGLANNKPIYGDSPDYKKAWLIGYRSCFDDTLAGVPPWRTLPWSGRPILETAEEKDPVNK